jgi:hypothetical protein
MALLVQPFDSIVAARVLDFFNHRTPWQRWLWSTGVVLTLKEVLEASEAVRAAVLSEASLSNLTNSISTIIGQDPGAGDSIQKRLLQESLKSAPKFMGFDWQRLKELASEIEQNYLVRWSLALRSGTNFPSGERTARSLASHLLDSGFSLDFCHRWWTYKIRHEPGSKALWQIVEDAQNLVQRPSTKYQVMVAFESAPSGAGGMPREWLNRTEVSNWLRVNGFSTKLVRQTGGLLLSVGARDPWAAVDFVGEVINRLGARVTVGTRGRLRAFPTVWIAGQKETFQLRRRQRALDVSALHRENQLYSIGPINVVDSAIQLLEPLALGGSGPGPAIAGAWAAIEALLSGPEGKEHVLAADRIASLVACSFPRAELTTLSYKLEALGGAIATRLRLCTTNEERSDTVATELSTAAGPLFLSESDNAAAARMRALISNPKPGLKDIYDHVQVAFRRLYRNRNLVLHWGKIDAVTLRATLRTTAPLVGAGMDRIAHAFFVDNIEPLVLAAKASINLAAVGSTSGPSVVELLE